jgi:hypothetical protein
LSHHLHRGLVLSTRVLDIKKPGGELTPTGLAGLLRAE